MADWTPAGISTMLWLDASDAATITIDTGVGQWADKSGNDNHAIQITDANQPTVSSAWLNGLDVLLFDGSNDGFDIDSALGSTVSIFYIQNTTDGTYIIFNDGTNNYGPCAQNGNSGVIGSNFGSPSYYKNGAVQSWTTRDNVHDGLYNSTNIVDIVGADLTTWAAFDISKYTTSTYLFSGRIAEIIIVAGAVDSATRQLVEGYLAWKWGLESSLPADHPYKSAAPTTEIPGITIKSTLYQVYELSDYLKSFLDQPYSVLTSLLSNLEQIYALRLGSHLDQFWSDSTAVKSYLEQYYKSCAELKRALNQVYGDSPQVKSVLDQEYRILSLVLSKLDQKYHIIGGQILSFLDQGYSIETNDRIKSFLQQNYMIAGSGAGELITMSVTVAGSEILCGGFDLNYSLDEYCGVCNITVNEEPVWRSINYLDPIVINLDDNIYDFVVVEKYEAESAGKTVFKVKGRSRSVVLDFPNATEMIDDSLVSGLCSEVVDSIAGLYRESINWEIPADESITAKEVQVSGSSPMAAIKKIVNEFRGAVQTSPDNVIKAMPRYPVDTDKYHLATISAVIDVFKDTNSCETSTEKRQGYNKYFVSNQGSTDGYTLDSKNISDTVDHVMASIVPWTSKAVYLTTSEETNVWIEAKGIVEEELTEEVEIKNGAGKLQKPCYGLVSTDYGTRSNLGDVSFKEDGSISVVPLASSMVTIKYKTRYWLWVVTGTDNENVQYILMSE